MRDAPSSDPSPPVLPWRLVAGAALHLILPAYLVALGVAWAAAGPGGAGALAFVGRVSARFLVIYAALAVTASVVAALADPPLRRVRARAEARDPAAPARRAATRVARALRRLEAIGGVRIAAAVAAARAARWDWADERDQAVAADLSRAADAFLAAHATAPPPERAEVADLAAAALERIAGAVTALAAERARLDRGDAAVHARYIAQRYGAAPDLRQAGLDGDGPVRD